MFYLSCVSHNVTHIVRYPDCVEAWTVFLFLQEIM